MHDPLTRGGPDRGADRPYPDPGIMTRTGPPPPRELPELIAARPQGRGRPRDRLQHAAWADLGAGADDRGTRGDMREEEAVFLALRHRARGALRSLRLPICARTMTGTRRRLNRIAAITHESFACRTTPAGAGGWLRLYEGDLASSPKILDEHMYLGERSALSAHRGARMSKGGTYASPPCMAAEIDPAYFDPLGAVS